MDIRPFSTIDLPKEGGVVQTRSSGSFAQTESIEGWAGVGGAGGAISVSGFSSGLASRFSARNEAQASGV